MFGAFFILCSMAISAVAGGALVGTPTWLISQDAVPTGIAAAAGAILGLFAYARWYDKPERDKERARRLQQHSASR